VTLVLLDHPEDKVNPVRLEMMVVLALLDHLVNRYQHYCGDYVLVLLHK